MDRLRTGPVVNPRLPFTDVSCLKAGKPTVFANAPELGAITTSVITPAATLVKVLLKFTCGKEGALKPELTDPLSAKYSENLSREASFKLVVQPKSL